MKTPAIVQRHPALRWLVPLAVLAVGGFALTSVLREHRNPAQALPQAVPAALVSGVEKSHETAFSGTVVSHLSLGLPALAAIPALARSKTAVSFSSLLSGSHTLQFWYGGRDRQRLALLGAGEETDLFRNGSDLWQWSSRDGVALHTTLANASANALVDQPPEALTPVALAGGAFAALDASTELSVVGETTVADRRAYELVLTPRNRTTKVASVHVAIDGATKVPLGVQVYAKGSAQPAVDVAFTSIRFGMPAERNFVFVPPPDATVTELSDDLTPLRSLSAAIASVHGSGWSTVYRLHGVRPGSERKPGKVIGADAFGDMSTVSGHWGKGRLVESKLLSLLVTRDGRVYAGAVRPAELFAVAAAGSDGK